MTIPITTTFHILLEIDRQEKEHRLDEIVYAVAYDQLQQLAELVKEPLERAASWICNTLLSCEFGSFDDDYESYVALAVKIALIISKNILISQGARCLIHFAKGVKKNFPDSSAVALIEAYRLDCTLWEPILEISQEVSSKLTGEIGRMRKERLF